eukprot:1176202-Prorocentrum_minimum.AAC.6
MSRGGQDDVRRGSGGGQEGVRRRSGDAAHLRLEHHVGVLPRVTQHLREGVRRGSGGGQARGSTGGLQGVYRGSTGIGQVRDAVPRVVRRVAVAVDDVIDVPVHLRGLGGIALHHLQVRAPVIHKRAVLARLSVTIPTHNPPFTIHSTRPWGNRRACYFEPRQTVTPLAQHPGGGGQSARRTFREIGVADSVVRD